ncbi:MAG: NAD(P)-dependent alcohol dehydrogenase [Acidobacteriota bacterium]|nr:NAD(P)-dependent alcohol dehydrogenase [Acidobacteriota bacterium]
MKACRFLESFGLEHLRFIDLPDLQPGPGQAVVRVRACSLNFRDLVVAKGGYGRAIAPPLTPLSDGAGEVLAVGDGVTRVKPGDRVCGIFMQRWIEGTVDDDKFASAMGGAIDGMLAGQVCLNADGLVKIPAHLSFEEAATLPCAAVTAWNALFCSEPLRPGESVAVLGTGGVSIFALQFAKMAGARVIATSSSDAKIERLRAMGADAAVNYKSTPEWDKPVRDFTGIGADHVVEVGGAGTLPLSIKAVRRAGHIALIGVLSGAGEIDPRPILMKSIRLQGVYVGSRRMFEQMNHAIENAGLKPVIDRVFPFAEAADAMRYMQSGAHFGKIVIRLD